MPGPYSTNAFRAVIGKWAGKTTGEALIGLARASIQDLAEGVVDDTHVDTGFLAANWQPSIGEPLEETKQEFGREAAQPKIAITLTDMTLGDIFFYTNVVEYAKYQEWGTSKMQGVFMVSKNVANWPTYVAEAVQRLGLAA